MRDAARHPPPPRAPGGRRSCPRLTGARLRTEPGASRPRFPAECAVGTVHTITPPAATWRRWPPDAGPWRSQACGRGPHGRGRGGRPAWCWRCSWPGARRPGRPAGSWPTRLFGVARPGLSGTSAPPSVPTRRARACASRSRRSTRPGRRRVAAHGAPGRLPAPDRSRTALRRRRPRAGRPGPGPFTGLPRRSMPAPRRAPTRPSSRPGPGRRTAGDTEWIGDVDNGLDADFQWMYNDGPDSGVPGCSGTETSGCWADRQIVLARFGSRHLVMGAAYDPTGDTSTGDRGGSSLAATLATVPRPGRPGLHGATPTPGSRPWRPLSAGRLRPLRAIPSSESDTGIRDPSHNVAPVPDYTRACASGRSTTPPPASAPCWPPSTTPMRWRGSGPWCCRPTSPAEHARPALRRRQPRAGGPGAPALRRPHDGARPATPSRARTTPTTRPTPDRPTSSTTPSGPAVVQRARCRLRVDVRRRLRQRQPRLPAPRRRGLLGTPQGHPRRLRLRRQPGDGRRRRHDGRHPQRRRGRHVHGGHAGRRRRAGASVHLQLGAGACAAAGAP